MSIERINFIRDFRIFRDFKWQDGLPEFGRFNLIYGWNASGKTTLSTLFSHLGKKEPVREGEVQFLVDGVAINGDCIATAALPQVKVFNRNSVQRSIFEIPNQQLPAVYYFGEDSAEKQREIESLKALAAEAAAERQESAGRKVNAEADFEGFCTDRAREIKNLLTSPGGGPYNNYDSRNFKATAGRLVSASPTVKPLGGAEREKYLPIKGASPMEKLASLPVAYPDLADMTKRVDGMLATSVLSTAIEELIAEPSVALWVGQGLPLHTGNMASSVCRFCGQPFPPERLKVLQGHFNDEFTRFQTAVDELGGEIDSAIKITEHIDPPKKGLLYPFLAGELERHADALRQEVSEALRYLGYLKKTLASKKEQPFQKMQLDPFLTSKRPAKQLGSELEAVNGVLENHNDHTENFTKEVIDARPALEQDEVLKAVGRYNQKIQAISDAAVANQIATAEEHKLREKIAEMEKQVLQHQIPAKELNDEMAAYLGSAELCFEVQEAGYTISRSGQPAMNLSEGERTAIAFMYFLKSLSDTSFDIKNGVVVIDDPVSSLDANSLYCAFGFMKARTKDAGQIFVLTHNFTLFRQVKNWFHYLNRGKGKDEAKRPAHFYMLSTTWDNGHRSAALCRLDPLLHEYESEYQYLFKRIYDEASKETVLGSLDSFYDLPNIARRLLEAFLAFKLPGNASDKLFRKMEEVDFESVKKTRLLRFLHTYSHSSEVAEPEHDVSILSETPAVLRDLLDLIRELDPSHYAGMVNRVRPNCDGSEELSSADI